MSSKLTFNPNYLDTQNLYPRPKALYTQWTFLLLVSGQQWQPAEEVSGKVRTRVLWSLSIPLKAANYLEGRRT